MIAEFIDSWGLFGQIYLSGWLIALLLSMIGVLVVAKDQIFLSAAVSQASTLGIALGMWAGVLIGAGTDTWIRSDAFLSVMAVLLAVIAALVTSRERSPYTESPEAVTGWVFLVSASGSILLLAHSPHGLAEIYRLLSSSLIGAAWEDVWLFALLSGVTALMLGLFHRRLLLLAIDPAMARAMGTRIRTLGIVQGIWLGLAAGLAMRVSGLLYTFGCLVLPALVAKSICREIRTMFMVAPLVAVSVGVLGFVLANYYDFPPAQMTVVLLCLALVLAWFVSSRRRRTQRPRIVRP